MIGDTDGTRYTPKQYAQRLLESQLTNLLEGYWVEDVERSNRVLRDYWHDGEQDKISRLRPMTEKEIAAVFDQLQKLVDRIGRKYLGW